MSLALNPCAFVASIRIGNDELIATWSNDFKFNNSMTDIDIIWENVDFESNCQASGNIQWDRRISSQASKHKTIE